MPELYDSEVVERIGGCEINLFGWPSPRPSYYVCVEWGRKFVDPDGVAKTSCTGSWYATLDDARAAARKYFNRSATPGEKTSVTVEAGGRSFLVEVTPL